MQQHICVDDMILLPYVYLDSDTERRLFTLHPEKAAKREEEGISEAKRTFEREEGVMRETVDKELQKINDLYQERCRDYAQMVSDECEGEISKSSAGETPDDFLCTVAVDIFANNAQDHPRMVSSSFVPSTAISTEDFSLAVSCNHITVSTDIKSL